LPEKQAILFEADLDSIEAEFNMPYLSSIERRALQKGIEQGRTEGIEKGRTEGIEKGRTEGMQRGIEKGRSEGLEKGRSQGRLQQLRKLLEHRFGALPEWTVERLGKASPSLLDDWAVRLLDASKVEDVFR